MCNMWALRDNASVEEVQRWMKEKQLMDMDHAHKKLAEDLPKIISLLYLAWFMSILYAFGFRRLREYIQSIFDFILHVIDFILHVIIVLLPTWLFLLSVIAVLIALK